MIMLIVLIIVAIFVIVIPTGSMLLSIDRSDRLLIHTISYAVALIIVISMLLVLTLSPETFGYQEIEAVSQNNVEGK